MNTPRHRKPVPGRLGCRGVALAGVLTAAAAHGAPSTTAAEPDPPSQATSRARTRNFEGAIGLILAYRPAYSGSSDRQVRPELAGFVRWGRYTLSGAGGFTTRAQDDVERGLDALLIRREHLRVNLALRFDPGRRDSSSGQLAGMGNIPATVRARLGVRWEPAPQWSATLSTNVDVLNRVGGYSVSGGVSHTLLLGPRERLVLGASLTGAGDRYLQAWFGVTPEQSAASGYPVYEASEGLRDVSVSATWRADFSERWAGFAGLGASRMLGPAADSPLVRQRNSVTLSAGLVRRF